MSVEIKSVKRGDVVVVEVYGDALDASNVQEFRTDVSHSVDGQKDIVFDLSGIKFVDSSGIGALLSVLRKTNALSGDVKLCNLQPNVKSLFDLVRMTRLFETFDTVDEAVASFST
jgi:anti-sigma B factor antagonist